MAFFYLLEECHLFLIVMKAYSTSLSRVYGLLLLVNGAREFWTATNKQMSVLVIVSRHDGNNLEMLLLLLMELIILVLLIVRG